MSEIYSHLLIPKDAAFAPELKTIAAFYDRLSGMDALPKDVTYVVLTNSGRARPIAKNPSTGETFYGPDLQISRCSELQSAIQSMTGKEINELWVEGRGPTAIFPFALYQANCPNAVWSGPYSFTVRCKVRKKVTHLLHSSFGCKCDVKAVEPGIFENPWNNQPIKTSGLGSARFWIEFGIGDWLIPMITDSLDILDARLVVLAVETFRMEFTQGCISNDD
ncbi:MAG: hypothetical protein ACRD25_12240 [Terracidiphilus sp.]